MFSPLYKVKCKGVDQSIADNLPDADREVFSDIESRVTSMSYYVDGFGAAVHLLERTSKEQIALDLLSHKLDFLAEDYREKHSVIRSHEYVLHHWLFCAARDAAISLYSFKKALEFVRADLKSSSPKIRACVENDLLVQAGKSFVKKFPDIDLIRHSISHSGETHRRSHAVRGPALVGNVLTAGDNFDGGSLVGNRYVCTYKRKALGYELSGENFDALCSILALVEGAFRSPEKDGTKYN